VPDSLSTIAELGIGLAGFSSIVVALGYRSRRLRPLDRMRVIGLLLGSLGAALLAVLPLILADSGNTPVVVWRASSAVFAVGLGSFLVYALSYRRTLSEAERAALHPGMWILTIGGILAFLPLLIWNSAALNGEPSSGPYLSGLYFLLVYSSAQFFRVLLVRPADAPTV
jgi:hypothetical protein